MTAKRITQGTFLAGLLGLMLGGCVITPHEGYYDGEHHRYYHENSWHECSDRDEHCHQ